MFEIFNEETFEFDEKMYFLTEQFRNRRPKPITYQRNYNDVTISNKIPYHDSKTGSLLIGVVSL